MHSFLVFNFCFFHAPIEIFKFLYFFTENALKSTKIHCKVSKIKKNPSLVIFSHCEMALTIIQVIKTDLRTLLGFLLL